MNSQVSRQRTRLLEEIENTKAKIARLERALGIKTRALNNYGQNRPARSHRHDC